MIIKTRNRIPETSINEKCYLIQAEKEKISTFGLIINIHQVHRKRKKIDQRSIV